MRGDAKFLMLALKEPTTYDDTREHGLGTSLSFGERSRRSTCFRNAGYAVNASGLG